MYMAMAVMLFVVFVLALACTGWILLEAVGGALVDGARQVTSWVSRWRSRVRAPGRRSVLVAQYGYVAVLVLGAIAGMVHHFGTVTGHSVVAGREIWRFEEREGLQAVCRGMKWGFLDSEGEEVVKPHFTVVRSFSEGLAPVSVDHRWGYIDRSGTFVIPPKYRLAGEHRDGRAPVGLDDFTLVYIDAQGNVINNTDATAPTKDDDVASTRG